MNFKMTSMATFSVAMLAAITLAGCAAPSFEPTTRAGADCKKECSVNQQSCRASSMTCDKGYANCIQSCIDIERVSKK